MKKLIAILLACLLLAASAYAAEWGDGLSPAHPYSGVPEVDLNQTIGYIWVFPRTKVPAKTFCDVLTIYLPRDDIKLNAGTLTVHNAADDSVVGTYDFTDGDHVELRPITDVELESLMWGGGVAVVVHLDESLKFGADYYVLMDQGCFASSNGKLPSPVIANPEYWHPALEGEYGVSGLYYCEPTEVPKAKEQEAAEEAEEELDDQGGVTDFGTMPGGEFEVEAGGNGFAMPDAEFEVEEDEPEETEAPAEPAEPAPIVYKVKPEVGDEIHFELVLGGEAKVAVPISNNDSVLMEQPEYTQSGMVSGVVTNANLDWGVVFLDDNGVIVNVVSVTGARSGS